MTHGPVQKDQYVNNPDSRSPSIARIGFPAMSLTLLVPVSPFFPLFSVSEQSRAEIPFLIRGVFIAQYAAHLLRLRLSRTSTIALRRRTRVPPLIREIALKGNRWAVSPPTPPTITVPNSYLLNSPTPRAPRRSSASFSTFQTLTVPASFT
ncbi:hypothetical protein F2Q69_00041927 [Brassica cretica]|uniref:Uncharacterized protein n=1 Tax=Brassica cretica TaxID=69181 RepID=A0A8S9NQS4_BRACR|nr:hypothetical protein F2Q69_00041927 [Brassica cretica]